MKLAIRTAKLDAITVQLSSSLELGAEHILAVPTNYSGITLLDLNESVVTSLSSTRYIEALLLDEEAAAALQQPSVVSDALSVKSLDGVDELEQYEHLSQLLHIQKATRNKR